jgi:hypothetical protein
MTGLEGLMRQQNRLKSRGAIDDNWEQTQQLFDRLKVTGRCRERKRDDDGRNLLESEPEGVTFTLDDHDGAVDIRDDHSNWGPIGNWTSEAGQFVLCMENHKRPFKKTASLQEAYEISVGLAKLPTKERRRFHPPLRDLYVSHDD